MSPALFTNVTITTIIRCVKEPIKPLTLCCEEEEEGAAIPVNHSATFLLMRTLQRWHHTVLTLIPGGHTNMSNSAAPYGIFWHAKDFMKTPEVEANAGETHAGFR